MTTERVPASEVDRAEHELADLIERRERVRSRLRELEVREGDLARLVNPAGPLPSGPGRIVLSHPDMSSQHELRNLRADIADLEGGIQSLDRRIEAVQGYLARARSADRETPHVLTEREQLEQERQRAAYDLVVSGKGERHLREAEARIADFERREELARLAERERQRLAAEAERERQEQERAALRSQRAQVQAQLMAKQREYQDLLAALIGVGEEIARLDDAQYDLGGRAEGWGTMLGQMGGARRRLERFTLARLSRSKLAMDAPPTHPADLEPLVPPGTEEPTDEPDDDPPDLAA